MSWVEYDLDEIAKYVGLKVWETDKIYEKLNHTANWTIYACQANKVGQMLSDLKFHTSTRYKRFRIWMLKFKKIEPTEKELELHRLKVAAFRDVVFKNLEKLK